MFYVVRNHSANQAYSVHLNVFKQKIQTLIESIPFMHVIDPVEINVKDNNSNVNIKFSFKLDYGVSVSDVVAKCNTEIERITMSLIDTRPTNIQLTFLGNQ